MLRSGRGCLTRLHASITLRQNTAGAKPWLWESSARSFVAGIEVAPKESHEGDYNVTEGPVKEDFIDTPLPGVSEEARKDPKGKWPHQDDRERREDLDVPDEGEAITKTSDYTPHTNPTASPDLSKRSYHTLRAVPRVLGYSVRGLHSDDLFLGEKHPDDEHADRIKKMDKNPDDPAHSHLPGDFDFLPPEADREDVMNPSRLQDPDKQMERRRAKDPEYFDRVHGGNPAQAREAFAQEAKDNAHAQRRKEGEDLFTADAERRKQRENA
ncbi:hypothetical protein COCOBI_16-2560 [Coccomyxa sp. Obi]|nr:hypothetical protein COCOBI_16-2560 [Coccomyxa sp. Obi]